MRLASGLGLTAIILRLERIRKRRAALAASPVLRPYTWATIQPALEFCRYVYGKRE